MTRETKVGIVVSCSFLGLVGVVIASKLREKPEDTTERPSPVALERGTADQQAGPKAGKGKSREPNAASAKPTPTMNGSVPKDPGSFQAPGPVTASSLPKGPETPPAVSGTGAPTPAMPPTPPEGPTPPAPPGGGTVPSVPPEVSGAVVGGAENSSSPLREAVAELIKEAKDKPPSPPPVEAVVGEGVVGDPVSPPALQPESNSAAPAPSLAPEAENDSHPLREAVAELAKEAKDEPTGSHPAEAVATVPAPPSTLQPEGGGAVPAPPLSTGAETATAPAVAPSTSPGLITPPAPPSSGGPTSKPPEPLTPPPPSSMGVTAPPSPAAAPTSPQAVPMVEDKSVKPQQEPSAVPVAPVVPASAPPPQEAAPAAPKVVASTPILAVPPVGARPTVESFTEEEYVVKANDTFESISKQFYQTPDYAEPLRLYNRNDSLLSDLGRDGSGALKPGQHLSIPRQWEILKKRYGDAIPAVRPAGTTAPAPGSETSNKVPLPSKEAAPPTPKPVTYRVPAGDGQGMYEMAKTLLGNGDRWMEIRNLNQQYDPALKIPAGREVRLPADARVAAVVEQP